MVEFPSVAVLMQTLVPLVAWCPYVTRWAERARTRRAGPRRKNVALRMIRAWRGESGPTPAANFGVPPRGARRLRARGPARTHQRVLGDMVARRTP